MIGLRQTDICGRADRITVRACDAPPLESPFHGISAGGKSMGLVLVGRAWRDCVFLITLMYYQVGDVVLKLPITQSEHEVVQRRVVQILDPYASLATLRSRHTSISSHLDLCSQCQFLPRFVHADLVRFVDHVAARLSCIFSEKTRMAVLSWRVLVQLIVRFG